MSDDHKKIIDAIWKRLSSPSQEPDNRRWFWQREKPAAEAIWPNDAEVAALSAAVPEEMLPALAGVLWRGGADLYPCLHQVVHVLASRMPTHAWPHVDEGIRQQTHFPSIMRRREGVPATKDPAFVLLAMCDANGRHRECALRCCEVLPAFTRCCLLLLRVNDWVKPVRKLAIRQIEQVIGELSEHQRMSIWPLIDRLDACGRHGAGDLLEEWRKLLVEPWSEEAWLHAWSNSSAKHRRSFLEMLKCRSVLPDEKIRLALLHSNDRRAILWLIRKVLPQLQDAALDEAVLLLEKSRVLPVRREWLTYQAETLPEQALPKLLGALLDRSRSLRQLARYYLARLQPMDFVQFYQGELGISDRQAIALIGLAEVSPEAAHLRALEWLHTEALALREAAIIVLAEHSLPEHFEYLLQAATSADMSIAKAARQRLIDAGQSLGAFLIEQKRRDFSPELWSFLVSRCAWFSKWDGLEFLLSCAQSQGASDTWLDALHRWEVRASRSYIRLIEDRKERLLNLLERTRLSAQLKDHMLFLLRVAEA